MARKWIVDHSREAIGRVWTEDDHCHLERTIREIDRTAQQVMSRNLGVTKDDLPSLRPITKADVDAALEGRKR